MGMQRFLSMRRRLLFLKNDQGKSFVSSSSSSTEKTLLQLLGNPKLQASSSAATPPPNNITTNVFRFLATTSRRSPVRVHQNHKYQFLQKSNALFNKMPPTTSKGLLQFHSVSSSTTSTTYFLHKTSHSNTSTFMLLKWFQRIDPDNLILCLVAANVAIFLLWQKADRQFMIENFMVSVDNFKSGRVHTMLTSAFSHMDAGHIVSNMIGLYVFGTSIGNAFGPEFLLKLYLAGALAGSIFYLVYHAFLIPSKSKEKWSMGSSSIPGLGASGAVDAIMLLDMFLNPKKTIYLNMIIPLPAILVGIYVIGKDMWRIIKGDTKVSGSVHLGGAAVAALMWARFYRKRRLF